MKKFFISLFTFVFFISLSFAGKITDTKPPLMQLKNEVRNELINNLLPFWSRLIDNKNGGFYGRVDANSVIYPEADKGGILNARILWTYSSAFRILKDSSYLELAKRSKDYILAHFIDLKYGGAFRNLKSTGDVEDSRKQTYTESFFIYGLTEYVRITGDKEALTCAKSIFELLEKYALDKNAGGYFEVFTRDWKRSHDLLIGEPGLMDEKTMNTHLHLLEAYTNLFRVWPDKRVGNRLRALIDISLDKIIDRNTSHLICFMDKNWNKTSEIDSYGHDIETSWLLNEAAGLLKDPILIARVKSTSVKIADAASEGLQPDGSMIYEKNKTTGEKNMERSWWAESETVVGYLNAFEITGEQRYLDRSVNCWNYIKEHLIDHKNGGWFNSITASGTPGNGDKGGFWVCPYHNSRMCLEIIERIPQP